MKMTIVQTSLEPDELKEFESVCKKEGLSKRQALRNAIMNWVREKKGLDPDDPLFTNKHGTIIQPRVVQALFQRLKAALGFPDDKKMTPHVFRHTGATMLRRNGMDISELQDLLGHASPNTTRIYAKNDIEAINVSYKKMHPLNHE